MNKLKNYNMAKDPAFLFYPNDWIGGTMGMTFEEKGAYIDLLMMQFNRGHMTSHMIGQVVGQVWDKLQHKFVQDEEGKWFNERLDSEKEKRSNFTLSRRNNKKGTNQHNKSRSYDQSYDKHMASHMENVNENVNVNVIINEDMWLIQKKRFLENEGFFYKFCTAKNISKNNLLIKANEFINDIDLKQDYKNVKELQKHFTNWFNIKIKNDGIDKKGLSYESDQRIAASVEYANRYRESNK